MQLRFFDFEVYPEWWCCTFGDLPKDVTSVDKLDENIKDTFKVVRSDRGNPRDELLAQMREDDIVNVGYNIKKYDLYIGNAIYQGFTPSQVYKISEMLIFDDKAVKTPEHIRLMPFTHKRMRVTHLDLFDSSTGSLKDKEAILGLSVEETTVPFGKSDLTDTEKDDIIKYNKHDVYSSMYWYLHTVKPFVDTKLILCRKFNIPEKYGYNCTNAGLVSKALHVEKATFSDENKVDITLPSQIKDYCEKWLPPEVLQHVLHHKETKKFKIFDNVVIFADGGIHSTYDVSKFRSYAGDRPVLYVTSNKDYCLINIDAGSYYPSIMIFLHTLSRCITQPKLFADIYQERLTIKHKANKTKEDDDTQLADKLILNTTYGASGSKWLDLYDPYQRTRTCRFGQLFLIALACKLTKTFPTLRVIQTNTDGILVYCKRSDLPKIKEYMEEWHQLSGINMDADHVEAIWQRDVNNYLLVKEGGKQKVKGAWLNHITLRPGYIMVSPRTAFACGNAVCEYLMHGTDIVKSLVNNKDIMDFTITTTKGKTFNRVIYRYANGLEIPAFNCNRVIASKDKKLGQIYKVKDLEDGPHYTVASSTPKHSLMLNDDMKQYTVDDLRDTIDYMYYIEKCSEQLEGSWLQLDSSGIFRTNQFNYFENQNID